MLLAQRSNGGPAARAALCVLLGVMAAACGGAAGNLVLMKDGYGMSYRLRINPGKEDVALADLDSWLDAGLAWRNFLDP